MGQAVRRRSVFFPEIKEIFLFDIKKGEGICRLPSSRSSFPGKSFLIDFSSPQGCMEALEFCAINRIPAVAGATGLSEAQKIKMKKISRKIPVFFSPNMSPAVNLTFIIAGLLAKNLDFDIHLHETHHCAKKDAPSGTALRYAEFISKAGKKVAITSARIGAITGEHELVYAGAGEKIVLKHSAFSRDIFADGAIKAGIWLTGKKPGLYSFADWFKIKL